MLSATNILVQYGDRTLLDNINLVITEKDKVGLVGRNGAGKSTLLKILASEISPDGGTVTRPSQSSLAFLHQEINLPQGRTVLGEALTAFEKLILMQKELEAINEEISNRTDYESNSYAKLLDRFSNLNEQYYLLEDDNSKASTEKILKSLGFKQTDMDRPTYEFSGGWQMRVVLAKMLLQKPDYLLLDEPTNHLDIESILWLESFLSNYPGGVIVISHDQQFLDNVTNRTVEIELGKVDDYKAPYSKYIDLRKDRREKLEASYQNQQKLIALRERTINRFMAKATKTKMAQSMKKQLDKLERIEIAPEDIASMNLNFVPAPRSGQVVVQAKNVYKSYDELGVLEGINLKLDRGDRVAFVGQNGQGKTTLAKIIIDQIEATKGEIELGHNVNIGYYAQDQAEALKGSKTLLETMEDNAPAEMQSRLRNILGAFMFSGEDVEKKVSVLSGGERARLALAIMLLRPFNLLVLDEPTNHLDILSKEVLKNALLNYDGSLIVVSHDRKFLSGLTQKTLEFRDKKIYTHLGDVNYFLAQRKMDDMRQVELEKGKNLQNKNNNISRSNITESSRVELNFEERKKLQRQISNTERKIEKLEAKLAKYEKDMSDPEFFHSDSSSEKTKEYSLLKQELEERNQEWEDLVAKTE